MCCLPLAAGVGRLARRCPAGVSLGKQELVKTFTARQKLASLAGAGKLAGDGSGVGGGAVLGDVLIKE